MKRFTKPALTVFGFLFPVCVVATVAGQMGLRENDLFHPRNFAKVGPVIGLPAPELDLTDLEGKKVSLKKYRGQIVVLVKGGYT